MRISMPRGDTRNIQFQVVNSDDETVDLDFSEIYFTVKRNATDSGFLFQKSLGDGTITADDEGYYNLTINPQDTDDLSFGSYEFDIEVIFSGSVKETVVGTLVLTREVTHARNER